MLKAACASLLASTLTLCGSSANAQESNRYFVAISQVSNYVTVRVNAQTWRVNIDPNRFLSVPKLYRGTSSNDLGGITVGGHALRAELGGNVFEGIETRISSRQRNDGITRQKFPSIARFVTTTFVPNGGLQTPKLYWLDLSEKKIFPPYLFDDSRDARTAYEFGIPERWLHHRFALAIVVARSKPDFIVFKSLSWAAYRALVDDVGLEWETRPNDIDKSELRSLRAQDPTIPDSFRPS